MKTPIYHKLYYGTPKKRSLILELGAQTEVAVLRSKVKRGLPSQVSSLSHSNCTGS